MCLIINQFSNSYSAVSQSANPSLSPNDLQNIKCVGPRATKLGQQMCK